MFSLVRLIDTAHPTSRDRVIQELRSVASGCGAERFVLAPTLPGARNGGDILLHLRFTDRDERDAQAAHLDGVLGNLDIAHVNGATYDGVPVPASEAPSTIYRSLLLRVRPGTDQGTIDAFEDDLRLLPRYVPSIHSWQLSRVERAVGTSQWTHVFEQEFRDLDGLTGPYLMHPIHWAHVDRWFDPECPDAIVRDRVCHSFCRLGSEECHS